jgi:hypothetical protein
MILVRPLTNYASTLFRSTFNIRLFHPPAFYALCLLSLIVSHSLTFFTPISGYRKAF